MSAVAGRSTLFGLGVLAAVALLSACDPPPPPLVVDSTTDAPDAAPGDGICATADGTCTLRAAVMEANESAAPLTIELQAGETYLLALPGANEDDGATGDLDVTSTMTIRGGATIDGGGLDRVFDVRAGSLTLHDVTVTGGAADEGAGVRVGSDAALSAIGADIRDNLATTGAGAIDVDGGQVVLAFTSITGNEGGSAGAVRSSGSVTGHSSTVSGNTATAGTGGIALDPDTAAGELHFVTVTDNSGTVGGISGPVHLTTSSVAAQATGPDCAGPVTSLGYNLDGDGTCLDGSGEGDQPETDPQLSPLATVASRTSGHLPRLGSPLVDAVPVGVAGCGEALGQIDQRVSARPFDGDGDGVASCDIGALESSGLTVNHAGDRPDSDPGDGICQDEGDPVGRCSLRAALEEAWANPGPSTVTIAADVPTISLVEGQLVAAGEVTVRANGATVDAQGASRVLLVADGADVTFEEITLTGGTAPIGGGVLATSGSEATFIDSSIAANESTGLYQCSYYYSGVSPGIPFDCEGRGGGAGIWSDGHLTLSRSTVSGNHSVGGGCELIEPNPVPVGYAELCTWTAGAGVHLASGSITDSTISGNVADRGQGAAISADGGAVAVLRSTVFDNTGQNQVQVCCTEQTRTGTITMHGTIVAGSSRACELGRIESLGFNLSHDVTCPFTQPGDSRNTDPLLSSLQDNGGPTHTHTPYMTSPVVDAIPVGTPGLCDDPAATDQRGVGRPQGPGCDIGSVEFHP